MNKKTFLWRYGIIVECACIALIVFMLVWQF